MSVSSTVAQAIQALQQSQSQTVPLPDTLPRDLLATVQILGQDPGLRRPLGVAGEAVFTAWTTAATGSGNRHTIIRGNGQVASVGAAVRIPPAILVTDGFGRPRPGETVTFRIPSPSGSSTLLETATTGQDGVASMTSWTLNPEPGINTLEARVSGKVVASFVAFGAATRRCEAHEGNGKSAPKGTKIDVAVRVVKADSGQPVSGVEVSFEVTGGGGNFGTSGTTITANTDSDGIARVEWTLDSTAGVNTLEADAEAADPVTLTATGI